MILIRTLFRHFLSEDDVQKVVSVSVDGKESQMVFVDHAHADMSVSEQRITKEGLSRN